MQNLKKEVEYVVALRTIASPCGVTYHAEFHSRPSTDCKNILLNDKRFSPKCSTCCFIDAIIIQNFKWVGDKDKKDDGAWKLCNQ